MTANRLKPIIFAAIFAFLAFVFARPVAATERDGAALALNGGSILLGDSDPANNPLLEDEFTLRFWVRLTGDSAEQTLIAQNGTIPWGLRTAGNGQITAFMGNTAVTHTVSINDGDWHYVHLAMLGFTNGDDKFLQIAVNSPFTVESILLPAADVFTGSSHPLEVGPISADFDEIIVQNTDEFEVDYYTILDGTEAFLHSYWSLDEGTGTQLLDLTANGQHGQIADDNARWIARIWEPQPNTVTTDTTAVTLIDAGFIGANSFQVVDDLTLALEPENATFGITTDDVPPEVDRRWSQVWDVRMINDVDSPKRGDDIRLVDISFHIGGAGGSGTFDTTGDYLLLYRPTEFWSFGGDAAAANGEAPFAVHPVLDVTTTAETVTFSVQLPPGSPATDEFRVRFADTEMTLGSVDSPLAVSLGGVQSGVDSAEITPILLTILLLTSAALAVAVQRRARLCIAVMMPVIAFIGLGVAVQPLAAAPNAICVWVGNTGDWDEPANWSCNAVPTPEDDVRVPNGTVTLNSNTTVHSFEQANGTVTGTGNLTVTENFTFTAGFHRGSGTTTVLGDMHMGGNDFRQLRDTRRLELVSGTLALVSSADFDIRDSGTEFYIGPNAIVDLLGGGDLGQNGTIINDGLIRQSANTTNGIFGQIRSNGHFEIISGSLHMRAVGTISGTTVLSDNTTLHFTSGSNVMYTAEAAITGGGDVTRGSGRATFDAPVAVRSVRSGGGSGHLIFNDRLTTGEVRVTGNFDVVELHDRVTTGDLVLTGGRIVARSTLTVTGNMTVTEPNSDSIFDATGSTLVFAPSAARACSSECTHFLHVADRNLTLHNLTVATDDHLIEQNNGRTISVNGTLDNRGSIENTQSAAPGAVGFGLTGVQMNFVTTGTLSVVTVERIDRSHHQATAAQDTGVHWFINDGFATGFDASVTLPATSPNAGTQVCQFFFSPRSSWMCNVDAFDPTAETVTLDNVSLFGSAWAVGNFIQTAVTLNHADTQQQTLTPMILFLMLLLLVSPLAVRHHLR